MLYTDVWGLQPGIQSPVETYENAFRWGPAGLGLITGGTIYANAIDPGNTPTYELRPGLLLGQRTSDGTWSNYAAGNTDGSEVANGVLLTGIRMTNILTGVAQARFYGVLVGGPVQAAKVLGLDLMARADMSDHFWFDDALNFPGNHWFPWRRFQTKTTNYAMVATDNFTHFDNTGAAGSVTLTLPAIANGYYFGFHAIANFTFAVTSFEGANIVAFNNASANTITFSTAGNIIGGGGVFYSNPAGTKWIFENRSAGANTVTVS
jgi:hypothetical protein